MKSPSAGDIFVGQFRLTEQIGAGGSGIVWRATDFRNEREVAVKFLAFSHRQPSAEILERLRTRFEREVEALAAVEHPNIVRLYDAHLGEELPFFVMELVQGSTFGERCAGMSTKEIVHCLIEVADAVSFAQDRGIFHRDLKPGNIMITEAGEAKVVDFGLSRMVVEIENELVPSGVTLTLSGEAAGTLGYASPEQLAGDWAAFGASSEVFSLGSILFEALGGELPYGRDINIDKLASHEDLRGRNSTVSRDLAEVVHKAIRIDADRRYRNADAFAKDLKNTLAGRPVDARVASERFYKAGKVVQRFAVPALVAISVIAATFFALYRESQLRERAQKSEQSAIDALARTLRAEKSAKIEAAQARQQAALARAQVLRSRGRFQDAWNALQSAFDESIAPEWEVGFFLADMRRLARERGEIIASIDLPSPVLALKCFAEADKFRFVTLGADGEIVLHRWHPDAERPRAGKAEIESRFQPQETYDRLLSYDENGVLVAQRIKPEGQWKTRILWLSPELEPQQTFLLDHKVLEAKVCGREQRLVAFVPEKSIAVANTATGEIINSVPWTAREHGHGNWHVGLAGRFGFVSGGSSRAPRAVIDLSTGKIVEKYDFECHMQRTLSDPTHSLVYWSRLDNTGPAKIAIHDRDKGALVHPATLLPKAIFRPGPVAFSPISTDGVIERFAAWQGHSLYRAKLDGSASAAAETVYLPSQFEPWKTEDRSILDYEETREILFLQNDNAPSEVTLVRLPSLDRDWETEPDFHHEHESEQWAMTRRMGNLLTVTSHRPAGWAGAAMNDAQDWFYLREYSATGEIVNEWVLEAPQRLRKADKNTRLFACRMACSVDGGRVALAIHEAESEEYGRNSGHSIVATYELAETDLAFISPANRVPLDAKVTSAHKWRHIRFIEGTDRIAIERSEDCLMILNPGAGEIEQRHHLGRIYFSTADGVHWVCGQFRRAAPITLLNALTGETTLLANGELNACVFDEENDEVIVGDGKESISFFSLRTGEKLRELKSALMPKAVLPRSDRLVAFNRTHRTTGSLLLIDRSSAEVISLLEPRCHVASNVLVVDPDNARALALTSEPGRVWLYRSEANSP